MRGERRSLQRRRFFLTLLLVAGTVACIGEVAFAQGSPFGKAPPAPVPSGLSGWILAEQARFYRALAERLRAAKADGTAAIGLFWLSFLYGAFHAAGPGHGKAVISSYLLADGSTIPRGVALSVLAALAQAVTAIALVGVAAIALGATARAMGETVRWLEIGAYSLIVAIGLLLVWRKGGALREAMKAKHADLELHAGHRHESGHDHLHGPEPAELKGKAWLKRGLAAVVAIGIRPCSGAIIVLVFALSQGMFGTGVAATFIMAAGTAITVSAIAMLAVGAKGIAARLAARPAGSGVLALRGLELVGAVLVVAVGLLLLTGQIASERLFPA